MGKTKKITAKNLKKVIVAMVDSFDKELFGKKSEDLEEYWFFKYNESKSLADNLYEFNNLLDLYKGFCERWENHHNGHVCIVERVRDKYIMPKINELVKEISKKS